MKNTELILIIILICLVCGISGLYLTRDNGEPKYHRGNVVYSNDYPDLLAVIYQFDKSTNLYMYRTYYFYKNKSYICEEFEYEEREPFERHYPEKFVSLDLKFAEHSTWIKCSS